MKNDERRVITVIEYQSPMEGESANNGTASSYAGFGRSRSMKPKGSALFDNMAPNRHLEVPSWYTVNDDIDDNNATSVPSHSRIKGKGCQIFIRFLSSRPSPLLPLPPHLTH